MNVILHRTIEDMCTTNSSEVRPSQGALAPVLHHLVPSTPSCNRLKELLVSRTNRIDVALVLAVVEHFQIKQTVQYYQKSTQLDKYSLMSLLDLSGKAQTLESATTR